MSRRPLSRRLAGCAAVLCTALLATGCHVGPHAKAGAGESLDICSAVSSYNGLSEPVLTDRASLTGYLAAAQRVFHRVDAKSDYRDLDGAKLAMPAQLVTTVREEQAAYAAEAKLVDAATSPAALHQAVQAFATSTGFSAADTAIELWAASNCG